MSNIIKLNLNNNLVGGSNINSLRKKIQPNGKFSELPYLSAQANAIGAVFGTDYYQQGKDAYGDKFIEGGVLPKMDFKGISTSISKPTASIADAGSLDRFWRPKIIDMDNALNETINLSLSNYDLLDKAFNIKSDGTIKLNSGLIQDIPEQPMELDGNTMIKLSDDDNITLEKLNSKTNKLIQNMKVIQPVILNDETMIELNDSGRNKIKLIDFMNETNIEISKIQSKLEPINEDQIQKIVEDLETVKGNIVNINKIVDYLYKRTE